MCSAPLSLRSRIPRWGFNGELSALAFRLSAALEAAAGADLT